MHNFVHFFLQKHLDAMATNEIQPALQIVENERAKLTRTEAIPTEDIVTMGAAEYVMNHLTEPMRHKAHKCVTGEMKHGNENVNRVNSTDNLDVNHRLNDRIDHVDQMEKDNTMKLEDLTLGQSQIVSELDGPTGSAEKENVDHAQAQAPDQDICQAYKVVWLHFFKVQDYINDVNLHIQKLQDIGRLLFSDNENPDNKNLLHRFQVHDCSKFLFKEVYGYVLKWTHGIECEEWKTALDDHLQNNDHHPEFYGGQEMDR